MPQTPNIFAFGGGLDLTSAALAVPSGRTISSYNYEPLAEGYGRFEGYERFDGTAKPSDEPFWTVTFKNGTLAVTTGNTINGATSGATAKVLLPPVLATGTWGGGNAAGTLVLASVTGTFIDGETLRIGATPFATSTSAAERNSAANDNLLEAYTEAAQEYRRLLIGAVPGSGPVRGVAVFNSTLYAWRDNVGATAGVMWRASSAGWVSVPLGSTMTFGAGLVEIEEGDVLTGATSGATATARRVVRNAGSWGSTAAGYIIVTSITGTFTPGEILRVGGVNHATLDSVAANTLNPGGRYDTINENFYGASNWQRMYGVSGTNRAFEFDGTVYVPIRTGMVDDRPTRIAVIAKGLALAFPGGSLQISAPGAPLSWTVLTGASEIGLGAEITNLVTANDSALAVFGQKRIAILQGRDSHSFQLDQLTQGDAGAESWTAQRIGTTVYVDQRGLRSLSATQSFGNFKAGLLSDVIEPYFRAKRAAGATLVLSYVVRAKSQYRMLWSDGTGLAVFMGRKQAEPLVFDLGELRLTCVTTAEMGAGVESIFAGAEDGFVYQLDSGTNFDGEPIRFLMATPYNHVGSAMMEKRFHGAKFEITCPPHVTLGISAQFNYGDGARPDAANEEFTLDGGGGAWDFVDWDNFYWSAPYQGFAECWFDGIGRNISLQIGGTSRLTEESHILRAYTLFTSPRRLVR